MKLSEVVNDYKKPSDNMIINSGYEEIVIYESDKSTLDNVLDEYGNCEVASAGRYTVTTVFVMLEPII